MNAFNLNPFFAEVSDKIPGVTELWTLGIIFAMTVFLICRRFKWTLIFFLPLALAWAVGVFREFFMDQFFKTAVIEEMGYSYLLQVIFANSLPLIALLILCALFLSHRIQKVNTVSA